MASRRPREKAPIGEVIGTLLFIVLMAFFFTKCVYETPEEKATKAAKAELESKRRDEKRAEDRRKGFHCLSSWDGSHREFTQIVKRRMNDPDSFEHVETRVTPVQSDTGRHSVMMKFRGRNAFGGVVINTAYGSYASDCSSPILISIMEWKMIDMKTVEDSANEIVNTIRVIDEHPDGPEVAVVEAWRIRAILEATSRWMEGNADNPHELGAALAGALQGLKAALRSSVAIELSRRLGKEGRRYAEFGDWYKTRKVRRDDARQDVSKDE